jgi:hypothetical protein
VQGTVRAVGMDMLDPAAVDRAIDHLVLTAVANEYQFLGPISAFTPEQIEHSLDKAPWLYQRRQVCGGETLVSLDI